MPLQDGEVFAGYTILRQLGSGGMGEIYLAQHPRLPRRDALKVLSTRVSTDPEYRERFNREADIAATLWHPHIVGVHDRGEFDGKLWISMDYVEGTDAGKLLADKYPNGMPSDEVVRITTAVADALDYAHQRQLLHRDVKPANILLAHPDSGTERVLLADFGIARWVDDATGLTATNMTVGTVAYAAPEQLMGERIDGRADQYSLAATAFHLLTGTPPFRHSNPAVVISQQLNTTPPEIGSRRPELSGLGPVFSKALSKAPQDRFETCIDFARALEHRIGTGASELGATDETIAAPKAISGAFQNPPAPRPFEDPATEVPAPGKRRRARPAIVVSAVLAVLLVGVSVVAAGLFKRDQDEPVSTPSSAAPAATETETETATATAAAPRPNVPVVVIGANCSTLGAAGVTASGAPAYCSILKPTSTKLWSLQRGEIASPTATPAPGEEIFAPAVEAAVRMCVQQTGQTRLRCLLNIRHANQLAQGR